MTILRTPLDPAKVSEQPIQKAERLGDLPAGPIREHFTWVTRMCVGGDPDDSTVVAFEGCERETHYLTGIAIVDADRWVVRVKVNGSSTAFFPIIKGMHYSSPFGVGGGGLGTKRAAFEYLATQQPTPAATEVDLAAANSELDLTDTAALIELAATRDAITGPRVGDFITYGDGTTLRLTHDHAELGLQTTPANGTGSGRFHLGAGGLDYSGSLDPIVRRETLTETGVTSLGAAWIWHHGRPAAHNGVDVMIPCRVFLTTEPKPRYA